MSKGASFSWDNSGFRYEKGIMEKERVFKS